MSKDYKRYMTYMENKKLKDKITKVMLDIDVKIKLLEHKPKSSRTNKFNINMLNQIKKILE